MKIDVLDKGFVELVHCSANEIQCVNAARASYESHSNLLSDGSVSNKDKRLLNFLLKNDHWEPFRHAHITFRVKAPIMVARQWFKYRIGHTHSEEPLSPPGDEPVVDLSHARSEASRRYIRGTPEFYLPSTWRSKPANSKQGSGPSMKKEVGDALTDRLDMLISECTAAYDAAIAAGVAPEQARLFLPYAAMYTTWMWTPSFEGLTHFLRQRLAHDAQSEIREYAEAVHKVALPHFPNILNVAIK